MKDSRCRLCSLPTNLFVAVLAVAAIGHPVPTFAQQMPASCVPAETDLTKLCPGKWCQVWLKAPSDTDPRRDPDDSGTIKEITKDEIVVSRIREGRNERKTPILGYLPYVGKFFTKVEVGRDEITSRIAVAKIARIRIVDPDQADSANH
jgi:hypothetical protein